MGIDQTIGALVQGSVLLGHGAEVRITRSGDRFSCWLGGFICGEGPTPHAAIDDSTWRLAKALKDHRDKQTQRALTQSAEANAVLDRLGVKL